MASVGTERVLLRVARVTPGGRGVSGWDMEVTRCIRVIKYQRHDAVVDGQDSQLSAVSRPDSRAGRCSVLPRSRGVPSTSLPSGGEAPVALVSVTQTLVDVLRDTGHQLDGAGMKTTFTFPSN